ncbi:MAG: hypothetical protein QM714_02815 [Nocardioides sp.]|uniref:hypothetical protein n=1 Tax=Nocardioides sp. TaxID=35761 RepID=UPI0039E4D8A7
MSTPTNLREGLDAAERAEAADNERALRVAEFLACADDEEKAEYWRARGRRC